MVTLVAPMNNHIANGGEKLLGNASSIKRRTDGRVYISGQMQRHVFFSAMERLNAAEGSPNGTYISNGDGISNRIEVDLRADLGGFMHTSKGEYSGRRTAPVSVTPAVARKESDITRDLLIRIKTLGESEKNQALATKEMSDHDEIVMNFFLDVPALSISKQYSYEKDYHVGTSYAKHVNEMERKRRAKLFLQSTRYMNDYASQARNAVSGEPQEVLIVLDNIMSRKASRYFLAEDAERKNILDELNERGVQYFIGSDVEGEISISKAYAAALEALEKSELFDPAGGDENVRTFAETFPEKAEKTQKS